MLSEHITLPRSQSFKLPSKVCSKCKLEKSPSDGVEMGPKFYCGRCWRNSAPRGSAGLAGLAKASRSTK